MELIAAFLTGVVGPALYLLINKVIIKRSLKKKCKVREAIVDTTIINNELDQIRDEFEGDRVWISQFHNGGNFYPTGKSISRRWKPKPRTQPEHPFCLSQLVL